MPKAKVFITRKIPDKGIRLLQEKFFLVKSPVGAEAVLSLLTDKIDSVFMDKVGSQLKIIANYAVGYDNIDLKEAKRRGVMVTNTPGVLTDNVAEHTLALLLSIAKRIPEADRFIRKGKFKGWEPLLFLGSELKGKILGVIGLGRIGSRVAEIAQNGFGMEIIYYDKFRNNKYNQFLHSKNYKFAPIKIIFKRADFISLHLPLTPKTKHLVGRKELGAMKKTAYLINTSRGSVINEKALVEALKNKQIAGASLDVFEKEPKLTPGLKKLDNVVLTPHIASASKETRDKMAVMAAQNIIYALEGRVPPNLIK